MVVHNEINILWSSISQKLNSTMAVMLSTGAIFVLEEKLLINYLMTEISSFSSIFYSHSLPKTSHLIAVNSNIVSFESMLLSLIASKIMMVIER